MMKTTNVETAVEAAAAVEVEAGTGITTPDGNTAKRKRAAGSILSSEQEAER
jgi:hypothetical protein